jgi:hypothetical protein
MAGRQARNDSLRRCFLLAPRGVAADTVAKLLTDRGVECLRPEDLLASGAVWSDELTSHLTTADFVVAIVPPSSPAQVAFELGLAHGLSKPALVIVAGRTVMPEELRGLTTARISDLGHISEAVPDLDRFLRHSKRTRSDTRPTSRGQGPDYMGSARERLANLRGEAYANREFELERLVADVFEHAGAEVQLEARPSANDDRVDLIVWSDDLAFEMGGPILVECKIYRGGIGSIAKDAEHTMRRLEELVQRSDAARLAILVFDDNRTAEMPPLRDTPRVLAFPVEQLLDAVERGTLTDEVLTRRRQAAYARGRVGADRVQ